MQLEELERRVLPSVIFDLKFNKIFMIGGSIVIINAILVGASIFAGDCWINYFRYNQTK